MSSCLLLLKMLSFKKWDLIFKKRICSLGANSFLEELTFTEMGGKNENKRVASPDSVPVHLHFNFSGALQENPPCPRKRGLSEGLTWARNKIQKRTLYKLNVRKASDGFYPEEKYRRTYLLIAIRVQHMRGQ